MVIVEKGGVVIDLLYGTVKPALVTTSIKQ